MQAAAKSAHDGGAATIGVFKESTGQAPNWIDLALFTGLGNARNFLNVTLSDSIIALPGDAGTLSEVALALKQGTPVIYLRCWKTVNGLVEQQGTYTESRPCRLKQTRRPHWPGSWMKRAGPHDGLVGSEVGYSRDTVHARGY
jgi:uncharacterized protein (TIGR00725 family)